MGWTAYYQVLRDHELDDDELAHVAKLVRAAQRRRWDGEAFGLVVATARRPSRVIAKGWNKLGGASDRTQLVATLDKLKALLPDADVRIADDYESFGKLAALVADNDEDGWSSVLSLVPPPPPKHAPILDTALATLANGASLDENMRTSTDLVRKAFTALGKKELEKAPIRALLEVCDPDVIAQLALSTYARLDTDARHAASSALDRVRDPLALVDAFLHAWTTPRGTYYYGDMALPASFVRAMAAQPRVRERWMIDITEFADTDERERRRAERAIHLLGESKHPDALAFLAAIVRRWRSVTPPHAIEHYVYLPALRYLSEAHAPTWTATTLLALEGRGFLRNGEASAVECSTLGDRDAALLALPVLRALLVQDIGVDEALIAIARLGAGAAPLEDALAPHLVYPSKRRREAARIALSSIRRTPPPADTYVPVGPDALVAHRNRAVRHSALATVHARKDPSLFAALVHAEHIDATLCAAIGWDSLPFTWHDWAPILGKQLASAGRSERLAFVQRGSASDLAPQRELAVITPLVSLVELDAAAIRAHYGALTFTLDEPTRASLLARERDAFGDRPPPP